MISEITSNDLENEILNVKQNMMEIYNFNNHKEKLNNINIIETVVTLFNQAFSNLQSKLQSNDSRKNKQFIHSGNKKPVDSMGDDNDLFVYLDSDWKTYGNKNLAAPILIKKNNTWNVLGSLKQLDSR